VQSFPAERRALRSVCFPPKAVQNLAIV